jgi:hypothetical protein
MGMSDIARLEYVVREQMKHIDELRAKYDGLVKAVFEQLGGAHASLVVVYSDPTKDAGLRVKAAAAALPYEKARITPLQQHEHFHLFAHLESARLKKKQATALKVLEGKIDLPTAANPSGAA